MPFVKLNAKEAKHPMKALRKGLMVTTLVSGILFFIVSMIFFNSIYLFLVYSQA